MCPDNVTLKHESAHAAASRSDASSLVEFSRRNSRGLDWDKDRGPVATFGGATLRVDNRCSRIDSNELESLGSFRKSKWSRSIERTATAGATRSAEQADSEKFRGSSGENPNGLWFATSSLGWADVGCSFKEKVWGRFNSSPCTTLDAPTGLSDETGQPYIPSRSRRRRSEVSSSDKKNSKRWDRVKRLSSRTKADLLFIRKWDEAGRRSENA